MFIITLCKNNFSFNKSFMQRQQQQNSRFCSRSKQNFPLAEAISHMQCRKTVITHPTTTKSTLLQSVQAELFFGKSYIPYAAPEDSNYTPNNNKIHTFAVGPSRTFLCQKLYAAPEDSNYTSNNNKIHAFAVGPSRIFLGQKLYPICSTGRQ